MGNTILSRNTPHLAERSQNDQCFQLPLSRAALPFRRMERSQMRGLNQEMVSPDAAWFSCGQRESALIPAEVSAYTPRSTRQNQPYTLCSSILGASGTIVLTSDVRRGPFESEAAQASACWR